MAEREAAASSSSGEVIAESSSNVAAVVDLSRASTASTVDLARSPSRREEHLECPVCTRVELGVHHQCREGHVFCAECDGQLPSRVCPVCRVPLGELRKAIRSREREQHIAALPAECAHCSSPLTRSELEDHDRICPRRPRSCSGAEAGCSWVGVLSELEEHELNCLVALRVKNERLRVRSETDRAENSRLRARVVALEDGERRLRQRTGRGPYDDDDGQQGEEMTLAEVGWFALGNVLNTLYFLCLLRSVRLVLQ